jgi:hypothetical protein
MSFLIERLPLTQSWHLIALVAAGAVVVGLVHRHIVRRIERERRALDDPAP